MSNARYSTPVWHEWPNGCSLPWLARNLDAESMLSAGVAVVVSEPLVISNQQVVIINPSHLQVVGKARVSGPGEYLRSEEATPVTDLDCCDVIIDNERTHGPSDDRDVFAIWRVSYRAGCGTRIRSQKESCEQDYAKNPAHSRPELNEPSQPRTPQALRAGGRDEEEGEKHSEER